MAKKSSLKRARQNLKRRMRNRKVKNAFKAAIKRLDSAIAEKRGKDEVKDLLTKTISLIDKASSKGVIKKNKANRKKSQISRKANAYLLGDS